MNRASRFNYNQIPSRRKGIILSMALNTWLVSGFLFSKNGVGTTIKKCQPLQSLWME